MSFAINYLFGSEKGGFIMRRRNLFIVAALCVTLALGGCRSNKLEDTGNAGTQGESTADAASEEDFGLEKLQISGEELQDTAVTRGTALMKYQSGYLYTLAIPQEKQTCAIAYNLVYLDPVQKTRIIMCNNSACKHTTAACVAGLTSSQQMNLCSDGKNLYYIKEINEKAGLTTIHLYRVPLDTMEVEKLTTLFRTAGGATFDSLEPIVYNGYYYNSQLLYDEKTSGESLVLYRCALKKDAVPEKIWSEVSLPEQPMRTVTDIQAEGNYVYYVLYYDDHSKVVRLDVSTGEVMEKDLETGTWGISLYDGSVYAVTQHELHRYTPALEDLEKIADISQEGAVTNVIVEADYIMIYMGGENGRVSLYSREGEKLGEYDQLGMTWILAGYDEENVYFTADTEEGQKIAQISMEGIKSGEAQMEEITG